MTAKRLTLWILVLLVAVEFIVAGASKFRPSSAWSQMFAAWGFPPWFRTAVGATEIACAVTLFMPRWRVRACTVLLVVMAGAAATHLTHGEPRRVILNVGLSGLLGLLMHLGRNPRGGP